MIHFALDNKFCRFIWPPFSSHIIRFSIIPNWLHSIISAVTQCLNNIVSPLLRTQIRFRLFHYISTLHSNLNLLNSTINTNFHCTKPAQNLLFLFPEVINLHSNSWCVAHHNIIWTITHGRQAQEVFSERPNQLNTIMILVWNRDHFEDYSIDYWRYKTFIIITFKIIHYLLLIFKFPISSRRTATIFFATGRMTDWQLFYGKESREKGWE